MATAYLFRSITTTYGTGCNAVDASRKNNPIAQDVLRKYYEAVGV